MEWINWAPELLLLVLLIAHLLAMNLKSNFQPALNAVLVLGSVFVQFIVYSNLEVMNVQSQYSALLIDGHAHFGRWITLMSLVVFGFQMFLHQTLSSAAKLRMQTFFLFFASFFNLIVMAKEPLLFGIAWLGAFCSVAFMILTESKNEIMRKRVYGLLGLISTLYAFSFCNLSIFPEHSSSVILVGLLICFGFFTSLHWIQSYLADSGTAQGWAAVLVYFGGAYFWVRFGGNVLQLYPETVGILFSVSGLSAAWFAFRTRSESIWLGASMLAASHMCWLSLLLEPAVGVPIFFGSGLLLMIVFSFAGYAFHAGSKMTAVIKIASALAIAGFPPLFSSHLYFGLIRALHERGGLFLPVAVALIWFLLSVSVVQLAGSLLASRDTVERLGRVTLKEKMILVLFLMSVIGLTWIQGPLFQLLNRPT
jgi:hypothetical protein